MLDLLTTLVTIIHIFVCLMLIGIVLLQQGKGADMGATFGGGSNTLFGASGADNFLTRVTTITAICFMCTSVFLAFHMREGSIAEGSLFKNAPAKEAPVGAAKPAAPVQGAEQPASGGQAPAAGTAPAEAAQAAAPAPVAEAPAAPASAPAAPAEAAPAAAPQAEQAPQ